MRIFDTVETREIPMVRLFLTRKEVELLASYLDDLKKDRPGGHVHFPTDDHQREIEIYIDHPEIK
jgi:hypothetical protein